MNVVIATDGSPSSSAALDWAAGFLDPATATVHVVSIVPFTALLVPMTPGAYMPETVIEDLREAAFDTAREALDDARLRLRASGLKATYLAREGEPARGIADIARGLGADLVIAGSGGKAPATKLVLGSVSEALLHSLPGAVLLVRAPETAAADASPAEGAPQAAAAPQAADAPQATVAPPAAAAPQAADAPQAEDARQAP